MNFDEKVVDRIKKLEREVERMRVKESPDMSSYLGITGKAADSDKLDGLDSTDFVLASGLGAWQSWTPTWTASTTNPTIGNGQLYGQYFLIGKMCTAYVYLRFGTTTTPGDGYWEISLPFMSGAFSGYINGTGYVYDDISSPKYMTIHPTLSASSNKISQWLWIIPVKNSNWLNSTMPFTWSGANNSRVQFSITYPIA